MKVLGSMAAQEYLDAAKSGREGRTAGVPYNFEFYVPDEEANSGMRPCGSKASFGCNLNSVTRVPRCSCRTAEGLGFFWP